MSILTHFLKKLNNVALHTPLNVQILNFDHKIDSSNFK
jgi:hypothetical protein